MVWKFSDARIVIPVFLFILVMVPAVFGAGAGDSRITVATVPEISSNVSAENVTIPVQYRQASEPVTVVNLQVTETLLPGPREMQFGPRSIRIASDPVSLVIVAVAIIALLAGAGYYFHTRKRREP